MTKSGKHYFERFLAKESSMEFEDALVELGKAIELEPTNIEYYLARSELQNLRGEYAVTIADASKVIALSTDLDELAYAHNLLLTAHGEVGDHASVLKDLDWLIENGFANVRRYMYRAQGHKHAGNQTEAMRDFNKVLEFEPNNEVALNNLAGIHYRMQDYEQAERGYSQVLIVGNQHPNARKFVHHWRGMTRHQMGKTKEALEDFNEVLRLRGDAPLAEIADYLALPLDMEWFYGGVSYTDS